MSYLKKFKGLSMPPPEQPRISNIAYSWLGALIAIGCLAALNLLSQYPLILGSFGASCFILFVVPSTPYAQPRNVIGGHFISSLIGLIFFHVISTEWWGMALALASCIAAMQFLKVSHPPAGSNPIIVYLSAPQWGFLFSPTLIGACILVLIALFYINLRKEQTYPQYW